MQKLSRLFTIGAATLLFAAPLQAQVIGAPATGSNCFPFGCGNGTRYQQVYDASNFSGPLSIGTINFFQTISVFGNLNVGTYTFSLSTTSVAVNALSPTFGDNLGADNALFGVFNLNGGLVNGGILSFSGGPFNYDPANGNLLLDIQTNITTAGNTFLDARNGDANGLYSRRHDFGSFHEDWGLVTEFAVGVNVVPEPSTYALMAAGLAMMGVLARRRRIRA